MGLGLRLGFPILSDMLQAKAFPCLSACTYMTICSRSIPTLPSGLRPRSFPEFRSILTLWNVCCRSVELERLASEEGVAAKVLDAMCNG